MSIKTIITKITAMACVAGVLMVANLPLLNAYEAHIINVKAEIKNDIPKIDPPEEKFCDDGELIVELSVTLADADIWYTLDYDDDPNDGGDPICHDPDNGHLYDEFLGTGDFPLYLYRAATVKAVSCHDGRQSAIMSKYYDVSAVYCDPTLKINKVYYDVDGRHGKECHSDNEWVELYNPTANPINLLNWKICDNHGCDILSSSDLFIPGGGYAVITYKENTWDYWHIPDDVNIIKIVLNSPIGDGLANAADMLLLKNPQGGIVDQMNWGQLPGDPSDWDNYNTNLWNPGITGAVRGDIVGRDPNGYDTDHVSDWRIFKLPSVTVTSPASPVTVTWYCGRTYPIKWEVNNFNGPDTDLKIDIVYIIDDSRVGSNRGVIDDGDTRFLVAENLSTGTAGTYYFTINQNYCFTGFAWAEVIATGPENFMMNSFGISSRIYEPMPPEGLSQDDFNNNSISGADGADNPDDPDDVPPVLGADAPASGAADNLISDSVADGGGGSENEEDEELIVAMEEDENGADVITGGESEDDDEEENEDNQDGGEVVARDEDESGAVDVDGDGTDDGEGEDEEIAAREEDADMADDDEESDDDSSGEDEPTVARDEEDGEAADDGESDDSADNLGGGDDNNNDDDGEEISDDNEDAGSDVISGDTDGDNANDGDNGDGDEEPTPSPSQEGNDSDTDGGDDLPMPIEDESGSAEIEFSFTPQVSSE